MELSKKCPICLANEIRTIDPGTRSPFVREIHCPNCGPFRYSIALESGLLFEGEHQDPTLGLGPMGSRARANAAGYLFWHPGQEFSKEADIRRLVTLQAPPLRERLDALLECVGRDTNNLGEYVRVDHLTWRGRSHSTTTGEVLELLNHLEIDAVIHSLLEKGPTSTRVRILPKGLLYLEEMRMRKNSQPAPSTNKEPGRVIFISHSESDRNLAKALVDYLEAGLKTKDHQILCTSIPGYQLKFGTPVIAQIQQKIVASKVALILLTQESLKSAWVMFEAGAAWALGVLPIPLIGADTEVKNCPDFFRQVPAVVLTNHDAGPRLQDVIQEISDAIGIETSPGGKAQAALESFLSMARLPTVPTAQARKIADQLEKTYRGWYKNGDPHVTVDGRPLHPDYGILSKYGYPANPSEKDDPVYAWGYGGTGPQQLAFMMILDCLGDEEEARVLAATFADRVMSHLSRESPWILSEREIRFEIGQIRNQRTDGVV